MRGLISQIGWQFDPAYQIPMNLQRIVESGWFVDETGAHLLTALHSGYRGTRSAYTDVTGYEAGVNGWGIDARDLPTDGEARTSELLQRSTAFVRAALVRSLELNSPQPLTAMISISESESSGDMGARVTFWASRPTEAPYVAEIDNYSEAVLLMSSADLSASP
jgi:hypothetical protein